MSLVEDVVTGSRCRALVASIELPQPFSLEGFVRAVEDRCGREIILQALAPGFGPEVSGVTGRTDEGYVLSYPQTANRWFSLFAVSHECGHILAGHLDEDAGAAVADRMSQETAAPALGGWVGAHLPEMQEAMAVWGVLYRCTMSEQVEREAELMATLFMQRIEVALGSGGDRAPAAVPRQAGDAEHLQVLSRYAQALGGRRERRRPARSTSV